MCSDYVSGVFHKEQSLDYIIHIFEALTGLKNRINHF